jgi:SAM-dependent methyltransferase
MKEFYKKVKSNNARPLLVKSFEFIDEKDTLKVAYDLGCGIGQDTFSLVDKGFSVKAVDISEDAFKFMNERFGENSQVEQIISSLEDLHLSPCSYINASLVLPFVKKEEFLNVIDKMKDSIKKEGLIVANFFGPKDDWKDKLVTKNLEEIKSLFSEFEVLYTNELEDDKPSAKGPVKHWHIIEIIAKK